MLPKIQHQRREGDADPAVDQTGKQENIFQKINKLPLEKPTPACTKKNHNSDHLTPRHTILIIAALCLAWSHVPNQTTDLQFIYNPQLPWNPPRVFTADTAHKTMAMTQPALEKMVVEHREPEGRPPENSKDNEAEENIMGCMLMLYEAIKHQQRTTNKNKQQEA